MTRLCHNFSHFHIWLIISMSHVTLEVMTHYLSLSVLPIWLFMEHLTSPVMLSEQLSYSTLTTFIINFSFHFSEVLQLCFLYLVVISVFNFNFMRISKFEFFFVHGMLYIFLYVYVSTAFSPFSNCCQCLSFTSIEAIWPHIAIC